MSENVKSKSRTRAIKESKRINVVIEARFEEDLNRKQDFVGFNGYAATFVFGEEIEMPETVIEFLRSKGKYKNTIGKDGELVKKFEKRYFIEKV